MAQNGDHQLAIGGLGDLLLKGGMSLVVLAFPADGFELGNARKLAVQALDHTLDPHALEMRVAGRGDEDANRSHRKHGQTGASNLQDQLRRSIVTANVSP